MGKKHVWHFSRIGGINRVNLESGSDLANLESLDQKLWTALSCPVAGLEIDIKTLQLIDTDNDGKIRVPEILTAVNWILSIITNPDDLLKRDQTMPLSAINQNQPEGKILYSAAKQILANLGKPEATELSVADTSDMEAIFANTRFNGDGIITENSTDDESLKTLINHIIASVGSETDRSGQPGIGSAQLETFFDLCTEYSAWFQQAEDHKENIFPFGEKTEEAFTLFSSLKAKIDDYFLRCRLAEFDPQSTETLNTMSDIMASISHQNVSNSLQQISEFPLAKIEANKSLMINTPINPVWKDKLSNFFNIVKTQISDNGSTLSEDEWNKLSALFEPFNRWKSEKVNTVDSLGLEYIRTFLSSQQKIQLSSLIEQDIALETEAISVIQVDKLVRYYRHIYTLLNNFITFSDFYTPGYKAIFQAGTIYFDQRSCDLCIKVSDMGKQGSMAPASGICLVYFDCFSKVKNEKITIVASFTAGDIDNLTVGRNAIFYDNKGLDWDATVIKIIDNPISIRQAFWTPYRKISTMISKQIEKIASVQDAKVNHSSSGFIENSSKLTDPVTKAAPFDIAKFAGIFAAIGLAFGAIGSVLTSIISGFLALVWWKIPLAIAGSILVISCPSMILAWMKLRKRNLAPILDANGWAINAKATINIAFGSSLTHVAKIPKNSKMNLNDPFSKKKRPLVPVLLLLLLTIIVSVSGYFYFFVK
ncbi:MAG TPA: hypothetical protein PKJ08_02780 [Candidatus Cloacimonadota bacterium]|nr:hypothetical protein [Candidatus Cloacimonadota bacterium]HOD53431.1 hypothetical protein [Candidatus Cloacimonadota bacterium]